jgi:hypothetical protein
MPLKTNNKSYDTINNNFMLFFLDCISHVQLHLQILDDKFLSVWRIFYPCRKTTVVRSMCFFHHNWVKPNSFSNKFLNSSGEISPKPLKRVISGFGFSFSIATFRSSSE